MKRRTCRRQRVPVNGRKKTQTAKKTLKFQNAEEFISLAAAAQQMF